MLEDFRPLVLDIFEAFPHGIAADDGIDLVAGFAIKGNMHGVGITEQVMHITKNFLIGADQKEADKIILIFFYPMQWQKFCAPVCADKAGDLTIGVTGNIGNRGIDLRLLLQTLNRHNRKELINRQESGID